MPKIPESDIDRVKRSTDLLALIWTSHANQYKKYANENDLALEWLLGYEHLAHEGKLAYSN